ncbi:MAG: hypothetical protein H3C47_07015 [Candidatus Cloacimonetes bacterium]|nr:hypothetical protein [Candidatus Cloacimonadota bacterium]
MMAVYWISFRIDARTVNGFSELERHDRLVKTVAMLSRMVWGDTTAFLAFESDTDIDSIAEECRAVISPDYDLFLISAMNGSVARICGNYRDPDIHDLMGNWRQI